MGNTQDSFDFFKKNPLSASLKEQLAKLHLGHKGFFFWEINLELMTYSFSDFLMQIKLCTYNDNGLIAESKLMSCIKTVLTDKEKIDLLLPILQHENLKQKGSDYSIDQVSSLFFLLCKAMPLTSPSSSMNDAQLSQAPIYDKAFYLIMQFGNEADTTISLKAFAAFILNSLIPMLSTLIQCYKSIKNNQLDSNESKLESLQETINNNKAQFFSYLLLTGASESITIQELNQRFSSDKTFLTADYFISAYLNQSF